MYIYFTDILDNIIIFFVLLGQNFFLCVTNTNVLFRLKEEKSSIILMHSVFFLHCYFHIFCQSKLRNTPLILFLLQGY